MHLKPFHSIDKALISLSLPLLSTLLIEPLLVMADTFMIGRIGTAELAGLSLAATILSTVIGCCIFLAYSTTTSTAQLIGANQNQKALQYGIDALWVAGGLGIGLALALSLTSNTLLPVFTSNQEVIFHAQQYLQISALGIPGMLISLATSGILRGFSLPKIPLIISTIGALLNVPLNIIFIYGCDLGVAGAALGTALAQNFIAIFLIRAVIKLHIPSYKIRWFCTSAGVLRITKHSLPLFWRTIYLRLALLLQVATAAAFGADFLASNQILMATWNFAAYGLDALAGAAQILIGQSLGKYQSLICTHTTKQQQVSSTEVTNALNDVQAILDRCLRWGWWSGVIIGISFVPLSFVLPQLFSLNPLVQNITNISLWILGLGMPLASLSYLLDGILIGANDTRKLAKYMKYALLTFTPLASLLYVFASALNTNGFYLLWLSYCIGFMGVRSYTMLQRIKNPAWMQQS